MSKVYNKLNYPDPAVEHSDLAKEFKLLADKLTKRLLYDLCTDEIESRLVYVRARLEYLERVVGVGN